jgi:hypothetical protein
MNPAFYPQIKQSYLERLKTSTTLYILQHSYLGVDTPEQLIAFLRENGVLCSPRENGDIFCTRARLVYSAYISNEILIERRAIARAEARIKELEGELPE